MGKLYLFYRDQCTRTASSLLLSCVASVGCQEYADKLTDSGVHGASLVLDVHLTGEVLANILAIPANKSYVRRHLLTEYHAIVQPAR